VLFANFCKQFADISSLLKKSKQKIKNSPKSYKKDSSRLIDIDIGFLPFLCPRTGQKRRGEEEKRRRGDLLWICCAGLKPKATQYRS